MGRVPRVRLRCCTERRIGVGCGQRGRDTLNPLAPLPERRKGHMARNASARQRRSYGQWRADNILPAGKAARNLSHARVAHRAAHSIRRVR